MKNLTHVYILWEGSIMMIMIVDENNETLVPETGFDINETDDLHSFLSFVNGSLENDRWIC